MSEMTPAPRRRPLWRLFFMPVLLLIAAAAWSAFWFYSASQVDVIADAWRAREAQSGRVYDCARRSVAGYPFRLEVRCDGASVSLVSQTAGEAATPAADHGTARRNPGDGADLRPETADRGIHRAGHDFRSRRPALDGGELAHGPQQRGRSAGGSAARLARLRRPFDRPDRGIACRRRWPRARHIELHGRLVEGTPSDHPDDRNRAADRWRQRAGRASAAGAAVRCRHPHPAERSEGFLAKAMAAAVSRNPGRRRPCRDRAFPDPAGRLCRGCRRLAQPQRRRASRRRIADDGCRP